MDNVFFSIVMPTYNRANMLAKAINSVLCQTYTNWELIVVDDGSTDETKALVNKFVQQDSRIHYIYQKNSERSAARNNGIKNAKGEFICFIDSDDEFLDNHLLTISNEILKKDNSIGLYFTDVIRNENGQIRKLPHDDVKNYKNVVSYFLFSKESVIPCRVSVHKTILEKHSFDRNINVSEDIDLWLRIALEYPVYHIGVETVLYYLHDDNSTNLNRNPFFVQLKVLRKIFGNRNLSKFVSNKDKREKLSNCYYGIARYYELKKQCFLMVKNLLISIMYKPISINNKIKIFMFFSCLKNKLEKIV